ncbi:redoxin domain-containing protein [Nocardia sp. ET3-3]|uniref:Redoxin domain-containing protein n=1 Tax=Nocardia terrae TaxID=2675851 RepID=A0A7K1VAJ1_9NOCA|nr:peroxiredoxin family protein [Nocardia terrae]MVU83118.1 redoxin domain-containing protein [Nocardia terrae]
MLTNGNPAPDLELIDTDGQPWRLSDQPGAHGTLLFFTRSISCAICNHHIRDLVARRAEFDTANIGVVIVAPEDRDAVRAWKTEHGVPFTVATGPTADPHESVGLNRRLFGSWLQSGTVLIDRDGLVRHAHGATMPTNSYDKKGITAAIESMRD